MKTAKATSKTAIKTTEQTAKAAQKTAKASAKAAQKAAQTAKATAKATAEATKATVKATIAAVRAIIAGTKALISALIAGGWIAVVIILIVVLLGCAVSLFGGGSDSTSYTPVSAEVEAYTPLIQKYAKQYGIPEYVELIKAVMMQESGERQRPDAGGGGSFNKKYPHEPNGIKDPEYSIECGVQGLKPPLFQPRWRTRLTWSASSSPCRATTSATGISHGQRPTTAAIPMQMRWSFPQCRHSGSVGRSTATRSTPPMCCDTTHTGGRSQAAAIKPL